MLGMVEPGAHSVLAEGAARAPVILVHGAANSGRVWTFWQAELARRGWSSHAIDLRGHGTGAPAELGTTPTPSSPRRAWPPALRLASRPPVAGGSRRFSSAGAWAG